jgi:hypothetical protein
MTVSQFFILSPRGDSIIHKVMRAGWGHCVIEGHALVLIVAYASLVDVVDIGRRTSAATAFRQCTKPSSAGCKISLFL